MLILTLLLVNFAVMIYSDYALQFSSKLDRFSASFIVSCSMLLTSGIWLLADPPDRPFNTIFFFFWMVASMLQHFQTGRRAADLT